MAGAEKDFTIAYLFDFYGEMLTENQKQAIDYYYNQDLSLAEIAQYSSITRQGVRDAIKRAEKLLLEYEEKLGLYARFHSMQQGLVEIQNAVDRLRAENRRAAYSPLIELEADRILKQTKHLYDFF